MPSKSAPPGGVRLLRSYSFAAHSSHEASNALAAYWQSKRADRIAPSRKDIDPIEMPHHLLPDVVLFDVLDGGHDFRYRLIGTNIVDGAGRDATGAVISQLYREIPDSLAAVNDILRRAVAAQGPLYVCGQIIWLRRHEILTDFNAVFLPLSADGTSVDMILCGLWPDLPQA